MTHVEQTVLSFISSFSCVMRKHRHFVGPAHTPVGQRDINLCDLVLIR